MISEIDFVSPCPVLDCKNTETKIRWCHQYCGGYERVTNQGKIYCRKCLTDGLFTDWKFNCGEHDYKKGSFQGFLYAINILVGLDTKNEKFKALLTKNVSEQYLRS